MNEHRKSKKNKSIKKPNKAYHYIEFEAVSDIDGKLSMSIDDMQALSIPGLIEGSVSIYKSYIRNSGKDKITSSITKTPHKPHLLQKHHILANFNYIAAIDTNSYKYAGRNLSISASLICDLKDAAVKPVKSRILPFCIIEDVSQEFNPEVIGWHLFIRDVIPILDIKDGNIALVVDSELGKHAAINKREIPYYEDNFLPENITLIYSSSDSGDETTNKLIKNCDNHSRKLYKHINCGKIVLPEKFGGKLIGCSSYTFLNNYDVNSI